MSDQTTDTNKTDADRKAEAEAEANAAWRRVEYFRYVMSGGQVGPYDRGYGSPLRFMPRRLDWRPSGSSTISTSRRKSGSSYCDERMKGTTRRLRLRS